MRVERITGKPSLSGTVRTALILFLVLGSVSLEARAEVRIAAIGDYGEEGAPLQSVAELIDRLDVEAVVTLGDNSYDATPIDDNIGQYFAEYIGDYSGVYGPGSSTNRFFPCLGNHDYSDGDGVSAYLSFFTLPGDSIPSSRTSGNERYYDFVYGPIHFFAINSNGQEPDGRDSTSVQAQWLRAGLAASTSAWKIVFFHHAAYSSAEEHGSTPTMQWPFEAWGASAVLAGHDHTYERLEVNGIPYFVNGLGGRSLRGFGTPLPESQARFSTDYGAMLIRAEETWIEFEMRTVTGDSLVDSYRIERNAPHLNVSSIQLDFGDTFMTTTRSIPITLENTGTSPLELQSIGLYGADSTAFTLVGGTAPKRPGGGDMISATLPYFMPVANHLVYTVLFTPEALGLHTAVLRIVSDDPEQGVHEVPLQGMGLPPPAPEMQVSATSLDFGDVVRLNSEVQTLRIWNAGNQGMRLLSFELQGEGVSEFALLTQSTPITMFPGDSTEVQVRFKPHQFGARSASIEIHSSDPQAEFLSVDLMGVGIPPDEPDIEIWTDSLVFAAVAPGSLSTLILPVHNQGAVALQITALQMSGTDADQFRVVAPAVPFTISPIDSSDLLLEFAPSTRGQKNATLQITSNDPNEGSVQVGLAGLGLSPDIAISSMAEDFGAVFVSEVSPWRAVTLVNEGNADLTVEGIEITGSDASHFQLQNGTAPFVLHAAGQRQIDVRFAPTSDGPMQATLEIQSDDPDESVLSLFITGTGVPVPEIGIGFEESATGEATGSSSVTTASALTAVAGQMYIAAIASKPIQSVNGVSGLGLSWTRARAQCGARGQTGVEVWVGSGVATPGKVTASFASSPNSATLIVGRYSGVDLQNPLGNLVSANTVGVGGSCDGGSDNDAYSFDLSTSTDEALVFGAVSMRYREHTPGPGFVLRDEARAGSGGNMASLDVMDRTIVTAGTVSIEGSFDGDVDWVVVALEILPATSPEIQVSPMSHDFGDLPTGTATTMDFEIRSVGSTTLEVPEIRIEGPDAAEFLVTAGAVVPPLPPGATHVVRIQWSPESLGTKTAAMHIVSNDRVRTVLEVPLQGQAVVSMPRIAASPASIDFGSVALQTQDSVLLTLRNIGSATLQVQGVDVVGADSLAFQVTPPGVPFSLAPGDSLQLPVAFAPVVEGGRNAALRIQSDAPETPVLLVPLTGEGVVPVDVQVVFEESVQGGSTSSATVATTGTLSAVAGDLYLAAMASKGYLPVTAVQGMGLVWTPVRAQCAGRQQTGVDLWIGSGTPFEGPVTATFSSTPANAVIVVSRYSGADPVSPLGAIVSANTNGLAGGCSGGSDSATFSLQVATSGQDAVVFAAVAKRYRQLSPGAGYVLREEATSGLDGTAAGLAIVDQEFAAGGIVPLNGSFDGSVDWAVVGVEIRPRQTQAVTRDDGRGAIRKPQVWLSSGVAGVVPWIEVSVPQSVPARVRVFDVRGRLVETLWDGPLPAGRRRLPWAGKDQKGADAAAGVYFVLSELGPHTFRGKIVLLH